MGRHEKAGVKVGASAAPLRLSAGGRADDTAARTLCLADVRLAH